MLSADLWAARVVCRVSLLLGGNKKGVRKNHKLGAGTNDLNLFLNTVQQRIKTSGSSYYLISNTPSLFSILNKKDKQICIYKLSLYKFMNISYCFVLNILRIKKYQVIFVHSKSTNYLSIQLPNLPLLKGVERFHAYCSYRPWRAMKRQLPTTTQPQPLTPKNTLFSSYCLLLHSVYRVIG